MSKRTLLIPLYCLTVIFFAGCDSKVVPTHDFPQKIDTQTKEIKLQEKRQIQLGSIRIDNLFDGARMNEAVLLDDSTIEVRIKPENERINPSPWYSFRLESDEERSISVVLEYGKYKHRYWPKISTDGKHWTDLDSAGANIRNINRPVFAVRVGPTPIYFSAQEIQNSGHVQEWIEAIPAAPYIEIFEYGSSKMGTILRGLEISATSTEDDPETIVIISRQHPPEVTGYFAMQAFVGEVLSDSYLSESFRKNYRVLIFPLLNPDGVDQGHWRHNAGGIDLNRDWAYYNQPEIKHLVTYIFDYLAKNDSNLILGLDFHSTKSDVYYTNDLEQEHIEGFRELWIESLLEAVGEDNAREAPGKVTAPISKDWFYTHFGAEGIVYEIGDNTPRDLIRTKGIISAREMMKLLVLR
jgi:hypothetical protein